MDVEWRDDFEHTASTVLHKRASLYGPKTIPDYNNAPEGPSAGCSNRCICNILQYTYKVE